MAKNRRIPFGYRMENGEITTEPREVSAVVKIFDEYIAGKSLVGIAKMRQAEGVPYHPSEDCSWNKNMVKRIIEDTRYLGDEKYPQIVDENKFRQANSHKQKKATNLCIVPEEMRDIRSMAICSECRKRLFRNQNGTWDCKTYRCGGFMHKVTDQMILSAALNIFNTAIANPSLLDSGGELSVYTPNGKVSVQKNEINRLKDSPGIDYERVKAELMRLAEIKYDCCSYDDVPQKTQYLKEQLTGREQFNKLEPETLKKYAVNISVSHYAGISLEMINGVRLINNTERKEISDERNGDTAKAAESC